MATVNVIMKMLDGAEGDNKENGENKKNNDPKEQRKDRKSTLKSLGSGVKKITGLQFGFSAFLKQSQVFTSIIGSIFQLIGALVDVILGPFIPLIIPLISGIAKIIPHVAKFAQMIADKLIGFINWIGKLWNEPVATLKALFEGLPQFIQAGLETFWGWLTASGPVAEIERQFVKLMAVFPAFRTAVAKFVAKIPGAVMRLGGKLISWGLKSMLPGIGHLIVAGVTKLKDFIINGIKTILKGVWGKLGQVLGKVPMMGKAAKALTSMGGTAKALAMGSKAVPVIGSLATLGFGAVETYKAYQKYGWTGAAAYGAKTLAATGLTLTGNSVAGMAVDMGGSVLLDQAFKLTVDQEHHDGTRTSQEISPNANGSLAMQANKMERDG